MDIESIRELARILGEYHLSKLEVTEDTLHILLEASAVKAIDLPLPAAAPAQMSSAEPKPPVMHHEQKSSESLSGLYEQKSPLVGTVYLCPDSTSPAFVAEGSTVKKGDTLCIIESMKMLNDIPADIDGTIRKICIDNEQVTEYGQPLFVIEPGK